MRESTIDSCVKIHSYRSVSHESHGIYSGTPCNFSLFEYFSLVAGYSGVSDTWFKTIAV